MRSLTISNLSVFIDDEDYERVSMFSWSAYSTNGLWYVSRKDENRKTIYLHRFILNVTSEMHVDHKNRNGLDNTKANLRVATRYQNMSNVKRCSRNTSGYKGVHWCKHQQKWVAMIGSGGLRFNLGSFDSPRLAAIVYNAAALEYHADFARLNDVGFTCDP
jgi:hypothetical protein